MAWRLHLLERLECKSPDVPNEGDLFAYRVRGIYRYGWVAKSRIQMGGGDSNLDCSLTYFYSARNEAALPVPILSKDRLLFPPVLLWEDSWKHSVFQFMHTVPASATTLLPQHCFQNGPEKFVDENKSVLPRKSEPCGAYGILNISSLEYMLAKTLEIITEWEEFRHLPVVTKSRETDFGQYGKVEVILVIAHEELDRVASDGPEIEASITASMDPTVGELIESGSDDEGGYLIFWVKNGDAKLAKQILGDELLGLGITKFNFRSPP